MTPQDIAQAAQKASQAVSEANLEAARKARSANVKRRQMCRAVEAAAREYVCARLDVGPERCEVTFRTVPSGPEDLSSVVVYVWDEGHRAASGYGVPS